MNDIRPTIILIFLVAIMAVLVIGITAVVADQHIAICLDHPTYHQCDSWNR
jgi:hypothetical protein